jgi:hypothetical protein
MRATAVLGLLVALGAFLVGPTAAAVRTRSTLEHGIGSLRGEAEAAGWHAGPVDRWTFAHKRALRICTVIAAGLVLMFWTRPTGWVVLLTALVVLLVLGVIEFFGRLPALPPVPVDGAGAAEALAGPDQPPGAAGDQAATAAPAGEQQLQLSDKGPRPAHR